MNEDNKYWIAYNTKSDEIYFHTASKSVLTVDAIVDSMSRNRNHYWMEDVEVGLFEINQLGEESC